MSNKRFNRALLYGGIREREWKALAHIGRKAKATNKIILDENPLCRYAFLQSPDTPQEVKDLISVVALSLHVLNLRAKRFQFELITANPTPPPDK